MGVQVDLVDKLGQAVISHRESFKQMIGGRYRELLPSIITYKYTKNPRICVDFLKVEYLLRNGRLPVIGEMKNGNIALLGLVRTTRSLNNPVNIYDYHILTEQEIDFIIPKKFIKSKMTEITRLDNCQTGEFIVLRNKTTELLNDYNLVTFYVDELAEIVTSMFSTVIQSKVHTIFRADIGDETINQIAAAFYNGQPLIKTSKLFDVEDSIINVDNKNIAQNLTALNHEYNNTLNKLNNILGISTSAVNKEGGISETELNSNQSFIKANSNIYLDGRSSIELLNKRYDFDIKPTYNDVVVSESISEIIGGITDE